MTELRVHKDCEITDPASRGFFKSGEPWVDSPVTRDARMDKSHPKCHVCRHDERHKIEALRVGGAGLEELAARFGVHKDSIHRHMKGHVSAETKISYLAGPAKLQDLANLAADENKSLIEYLGILRSILFGQLDRCAQRDKPYEVERVGGRLLDVLREVGRLTGEVSAFTSQTLNISNTINVLNTPEFIDLQTGLLQLCAAHPEVRCDVIALFRGLSEKHAPKLIEAEAAA